MGLRLLHNAEKIKQTDVIFWKTEENMDLPCIYLAVTLIFELFWPWKIYFSIAPKRPICPEKRVED